MLYLCIYIIKTGKQKFNCTVPPVEQVVRILRCCEAYPFFLTK